MLTRAVLNFLRDLVSPALFETWLAGVIATLVFIGALALGLLVVPRPVARPALRALAGFPLFFLLGGTAGILVYLAGGTVRMGLGALLILSIGIAIAALWRGELRELLRWRDISHLGVLLLLGFSLAFFGWGETRDGTVRAMSGAWGDGPLHTLNAEAFRLQAGPDLSFPAFAGESFHEPFGYDFVAAMLREAGFTIGGAFALPAAGLLACLLGWSGALVVRLSGLKAARSASFAAALLILTFGGFQWMEMAQRTGSWAPARFFGVHESAWAKGEALGLIWDNHLNTFSSQKHLLLASAFLVVLVAMLLEFLKRAEVSLASVEPSDPSPPAGSDGQGGHGSTPRFLFQKALSYKRALFQQENGDKKLLLFGVATGLLPLFHAHAFLAAGLLWLSAVILSRSRVLFWLGVLAAAVAAPIILWQSSLFTRAGFLSLDLGWMASGGVFGWIGFWLKNLGVFAPLAVLAVMRGYRRDRGNVMLLALPAAALFIVANVIQFQPYRWDNFKLFLLAWLLLLPLVVAEMSRWRFVGARILTWGLVFVMSLTTLADLATHARFRERYPVYTAADRAVAHRLDAELPKDAVVLAHTDSVHNHPLTLTGRTLVAGYGGWLWTRNYAWMERSALAEELWTADPVRFCALAARVGVTHMVDGRSRVRIIANEC